MKEIMKRLGGLPSALSVIVFMVMISGCEIEGLEEVERLLPAV